MNIPEFSTFRLVGGTSLSLRLGHRESVDIDLFTDSEYGSIDFNELEIILQNLFSYIDSTNVGIVGMGKSYFVGKNKNELIKLDLYYTDAFVFPCQTIQNIRFSGIEEIAAMKLEVIAQGGRKKDFWDIHELLNTYSIDELFTYYSKRNPYGFSRNELLHQLLDFSIAEHDFIPKCFRNKDWEIIKLDIEELAHHYKNASKS